MTHDPGEAFEEGRRAAATGRTPSANPYPPSSDRREIWLEGYDYVAGLSKERPAKD